MPWLFASSVGLRPSSRTASTTYRPSPTSTPLIAKGVHYVPRHPSGIRRTRTPPPPRTVRWRDRRIDLVTRVVRVSRHVLPLYVVLAASAISTTGNLVALLAVHWFVCGSYKSSIVRRWDSEVERADA